MTDSVLFFDKFFSYNNEKVGINFLKAMNLPKDVEELLKEYYIDHLEQKEIAAKHNIEERTVRARLAYSRDLCRMKAVGFFSNYFADPK